MHYLNVLLISFFPLCGNPSYLDYSLNSICSVCWWNFLLSLCFTYSVNLLRISFESLLLNMSSCFLVFDSYYQVVVLPSHTMASRGNLILLIRFHRWIMLEICFSMCCASFFYIAWNWLQKQHAYAICNVNITTQLLQIFCMYMLFLCSSVECDLFPFFVILFVNFIIRTISNPP